MAPSSFLAYEVRYRAAVRSLAAPPRRRSARLLALWLAAARPRWGGARSDAARAARGAHSAIAPAWAAGRGVGLALTLRVARGARVTSELTSSALMSTALRMRRTRPRQRQWLRSAARAGLMVGLGLTVAFAFTTLSSHAAFADDGGGDGGGGGGGDSSSSGSSSGGSSDGSGGQGSDGQGSDNSGYGSGSGYGSSGYGSSGYGSGSGSTGVTSDQGSTGSAGDQGSTGGAASDQGSSGSGPGDGYGGGAGDQSSAAAADGGAAGTDSGAQSAAGGADDSAPSGSSAASPSGDGASAAPSADATGGGQQGDAAGGGEPAQSAPAAAADEGAADGIQAAPAPAPDATAPATSAPAAPTSDEGAPDGIAPAPAADATGSQPAPQSEGSVASATPADTTPAASSPAATTPDSTTPNATAPSGDDDQSAVATPSATDATETDATPAGTTPADTTPADTTPATSGDTTPAGPASETTPATASESAPADTTPAPADGSTGPAAADPTPSEDAAPPTTASVSAPPAQDPTSSTSLGLLGGLALGTLVGFTPVPDAAPAAPPTVVAPDSIYQDYEPAVTPNTIYQDYEPAVTPNTIYQDYEPAVTPTTIYQDYEPPRPVDGTVAIGPLDPTNQDPTVVARLLALSHIGQNLNVTVDTGGMFQFGGGLVEIGSGWTLTGAYASQDYASVPGQWIGNLTLRIGPLTGLGTAVGNEHVATLQSGVITEGSGYGIQVGPSGIGAAPDEGTTSYADVGVNIDVQTVLAPVAPEVAVALNRFHVTSAEGGVLVNAADGRYSVSAYMAGESDLSLDSINSLMKSLIPGMDKVAVTVAPDQTGAKSKVIVGVGVTVGGTYSVSPDSGAASPSGPTPSSDSQTDVAPAPTEEVDRSDRD